MYQLQLLPQNGTIILRNKLSRLMKYTVKDLRRDFPNDDACLAWLVDWLYPDGITCKNCAKVTKHHKVKSRRSYSCDECGHHVHPTTGTIFHNSHVPLTDWFEAIWVMSSNKAGTSAKQIERQLGVTYKTAWRMMHQIRKMMDAPEGLLDGEVEIDETFIHPNSFKRSSARKKYGYDVRRSGEVVFGIVQRGGIVKVWHVPGTGVRVLMPIIERNVVYGNIIHTDGYHGYRGLTKTGYEHRWTDHGKGQYYTPDSYTQNIENVWSHFKRGIKGVYRHIGKDYIQAYANEYAWRYSNRNKPSMFWSLMARIGN
jgi:transposase-like protein